MNKTYKQKMSIHLANGGLWGDFIVMFWISKYLQHSIHVWNKSNGKIMSKLVGNEYNTKILHIVYGHFEPTTMHNQIVDVVNAYHCNINNKTSKNFETKKKSNIKVKGLVGVLN